MSSSDSDDIQGVFTRECQPRFNSCTSSPEMSCNPIINFYVGGFTLEYCESVRLGSYVNGGGGAD